MNIKFSIALGLVIIILLISDLTRLLKQLTSQSSNSLTSQSQFPSPTPQMLSPSPKPTLSADNTGILTKKSTNGWKIFRSPHNYEFSFPAEWSENKEISNISGNISLEYYVSGKKYIFSTAIGGHGGPIADKITNTNIILDGNKFIKRTWIKDGYPFAISVMLDQPNSALDPKATVSNELDHIEIMLPKENNEEYLKIFDQILSTFKFFASK